MTCDRHHLLGYSGSYGSVEQFYSKVPDFTTPIIYPLGPKYSVTFFDNSSFKKEAICVCEVLFCMISQQAQNTNFPFEKKHSC